MDRLADAPAGEQVLDLADADDRNPAFGEPIQQRRAKRVERVVATVRRARERARLADERPRDDAARRPSPRPTSSNAIVTDPVQLVDRDDRLVRGNLEHAVRRRVDDRRTRCACARAELVDDDRAGRRPMLPMVVAADPPLELRDELARKSRAETSGTAVRARCRPSPSVRSPSPCRPTPRPCGRTRRATRTIVAADVDQPGQARGRASVGHAQGNLLRDVPDACCCPRHRTPRRRAARRCPPSP